MEATTLKQRVSHPSAATRRRAALRHEDGRAIPVEDVLAVEAPLEIRLNGNPLTVTMRTPGADRMLARGLLHTEGILAPDTHVEWKDQTATGDSGVTILDAIVPAGEVLRDAKGDRTLVATTSCGLCGRTQFREDEIIGGCPLRLEGLQPADPALFGDLMEAMRREQRAFAESGGVHAAALFDGAGKLLAAYEDVGRHNAVDKAVGWLLTEGAGREVVVLAVSGRVSYEIVIKAWRARIANLIAVSAPTTLAVETGDRLGVTIAGFCRGNRATIYTGTPVTRQARGEG